MVITSRHTHSKRWLRRYQAKARRSGGGSRAGAATATRNKCFREKKVQHRACLCRHAYRRIASGSRVTYVHFGRRLGFCQCTAATPRRIPSNLFSHVNSPWPSGYTSTPPEADNDLTASKPSGLRQTSPWVPQVSLAPASLQLTLPDPCMAHPWTFTCRWAACWKLQLTASKTRGRTL